MVRRVHSQSSLVNIAKSNKRSRSPTYFLYFNGKTSLSVVHNNGELYFRLCFKLMASTRAIGITLTSYDRNVFIMMTTRQYL